MSPTTISVRRVGRSLARDGKLAIRTFAPTDDTRWSPVNERVCVSRGLACRGATRGSHAHPCRDLSGRDDQSGGRKSLHRSLVLRRPRRIGARGGISRSGRKSFLRDGIWVGRVGPPLWDAAAGGTAPIPGVSRWIAPCCLHAG